MDASNPTTGSSVALAQFAAELQYERIPRAVAERVKLCVLDAIGCAVFATTLPWSRVLARYTRDMGGEATAGIWGMGQAVPAPNAALVNGTLIHGFELDDLHKKSIVHPSCVALPAALALLESKAAASGRDLITALVAGFEVGIRAGLSVGTSHLLRGFHPTGTSGAVGAAAAAGRALGLSARQMEHAISIGASQAAGLMSAQYESMVKRMHAGRAAQSGVYAAQLAERGFVGIDGVFEVEYGGYCTTFSDTPDLTALTNHLGRRFETDNVGFKIYSCCGSCQTSVEAIRRMRHRQPIDPAAVQRVDVRASHATALHVGWPYEPKSVTSAQMNLPYCLAVTLIDGDAFVEQFSEARIGEAKVVALAGRVGVSSDPGIDAMGPSARHRVGVSVVLADGQAIEETVDSAKGFDADPLTPEEVVDKFHRLAEPVAGRQWAGQLFDVVMSLDSARPLARLYALLCTALQPNSQSTRELAG